MLPLNKKRLDLLQNALFEAKEKYGVTHLRSSTVLLRAKIAVRK